MLKELAALLSKSPSGVAISYQLHGDDSLHSALLTRVDEVGMVVQFPERTLFLPWTSVGHVEDPHVG